MADDGIRRSKKPLSTRQSEVLRLIAEGQSLKEIAYRLRITYSAAAQHRIKLMDKLRVHELAGLIKYAIEHCESLRMNDQSATRVLTKSASRS